MNLLKVLFRPKTWRRYKKPKFKIIEQVYFNGTRNYWVYETNKDIRNGKYLVIEKMQKAMWNLKSPIA